MARIVKRKRRKVRLIGFASLFFIASVLALLLTSLMVKTTNASLTMKIQAMNEELEALKAENTTLNFDIQNLENKERVYVIAQSANMIQNQDNIITLQGE